MIKFDIAQITHPSYSLLDYTKWRYAYNGGSLFVNKYLEQFSKREDTTEFEQRKKLTYSPSFAKAAINDIRNSIYQRLSEITRIGGDESYKEAISGLRGGVDRVGNSMNGFIGQEVLNELLIMGRVGIFVDKPDINSPLLSNAKDAVPYLTYYTAENVRSWTYDYSNSEYVNVLLRARVFKYDGKTGLPIGETQEYRRFFKNSLGTVTFERWGDAEEPLEIKVLPLTRVPFVMMSLSSSLMEDIADYQIALLNIASSDLNYIFRANFPIYTEQYTQMSDMVNNRGPDDKKAVGVVKGVRYPTGAERPGFIAPPTDPIKASMEKQEQMKSEIRMLLNLALSSLQSNHASAESKKLDDRSLECGLSAIGFELQYGEAEVAKIWAMYQGGKPAMVAYPEKYELKTDLDRLSLAEAYSKQKTAVPSRTFQKEVSKKISNVLLGGRVPLETTQKIDKEIDSAEYITSNYEEVRSDVELGLVSAETASYARGYNAEKEVPVAKEEHIERLKRIAVAQTPGAGAARGIPTDPTDDSAKLEKQKVE